MIKLVIVTEDGHIKKVRTNSQQSFDFEIIELLDAEYDGANPADKDRLDGIRKSTRTII